MQRLDFFKHPTVVAHRKTNDLSFSLKTEEVRIPIFSKPDPVYAKPEDPEIKLKKPPKNLETTEVKNVLSEIRISNPSLFPVKRVVIVIACHTISALKYKILVNNIDYLKTAGFPIFLVNTKGTEKYNYKLPNVETTLFIPNDSMTDFGKWAHAIDVCDLKKFEYAVFTNDSIIMTANVNPFYKELGRTDLLAWNDSTELKHHYQSYFFAIRTTKLTPFRTFVAKQVPFVSSHLELVARCELPLMKVYSSHACFLRIGNIPGNQGININFNNDDFLYLLLVNDCLPFVKVKRLKINNFSEKIKTFLLEHVDAALARELRKLFKIKDIFTKRKE